MKKYVIYRTNRLIYYYVTNIRKSFFKAKIRKDNKIYKKKRLSKDKFYNEISKLQNSK